MKRVVGWANHLATYEPAQAVFLKRRDRGRFGHPVGERWMLDEIGNRQRVEPTRTGPRHGLAEVATRSAHDDPSA